MLSYSAPARVATSGTLVATMCRAAASQPLSTDDRIGVSGSPVDGQAVSTAPVWWSYQLKYWPLGWWRSMVSRERSVRSRRLTASLWPMIPRRSATRVLHM